MREKMREAGNVPPGRGARIAEGEIVMRAETLQARPATVSLAPGIELFPQVSNLFPEQARCPVTATWFQLHDRRRDLDDPGIEINRAAGWKLERAAGPRNHPAADEILRRSENVFRPPLHVVDEKGKLRFQTDDRSGRWRISARSPLGWILQVSLHSRGTKVR